MGRGANGAAAGVGGRVYRGPGQPPRGLPPGRRGYSVRATRTGQMPRGPLLHGVGIGMEPPVVADGIGDDEVLVEESVALTSWVETEGVGGHLRPRRRDRWRRRASAHKQVHAVTDRFVVDFDHHDPRLPRHRPRGVGRLRSARCVQPGLRRFLGGQRLRRGQHREP